MNSDILKIYLEAKRGILLPSNMEDQYRNAIHSKVPLAASLFFEESSDAVNAIRSINVEYVISQKKMPEFVIFGNKPYIIYDQYCGQFLNMCNRLHLYATSTHESLIYFHKTVAEECRSSLKGHLCAWLILMYMDNRQKISPPNGKIRHGLFTLMQERYAILHEIYHAAQKLSPMAVKKINEASKNIILLRAKAAKAFYSPKKTSKSMKFLSFQEQFFADPSINYDENIEDLFEVPPDEMDSLCEEISADMFAFASTMQIATIEASSKSDDARLIGNRHAYLRDAAMACFIGSLHIRALTAARNTIARDATGEGADLITKQFRQQAIRTSAMHGHCRNFLDANIDEAALEIDIPRELLPGLKQTTGLSASTAAMMTAQKRHHKFILDPLTQLTASALSPSGRLKEMIDEFRQNSESDGNSEYHIMRAFDSIWKAQQNGGAKLFTLQT